MAAPVLPPTTTAAAVAVMSVCVVIAAVAASLASAAPVSSGSGTPAVGLPAPLLMAARGGGGRVGDSEPVEMDSEAHRRVVLALRGDDPLPASIVLQSNKVWCKAPCTGKPGDPYVPDPRGCKKIYHCPGATSANEFVY